jgi:hypothetical protein
MDLVRQMSLTRREAHATHRSPVSLLDIAWQGTQLLVGDAPSSVELV